MAENEKQGVDGSLIFDTTIETEQFEQTLHELEQAAERANVEVVAEASINKSEYEADKAELNRDAERGLEDMEADARVDDARFRQDVQGLENTAERLLDDANGAIQNGELVIDARVDSSGMGSVGDIIKGTLGSNFLQAGLEKLVEVGKKGVQLASDLEEVQNVVDVTFTESKERIEQFAKSASASYGLTELQTKQFSGTIGSLVKSMGISESAAADMAMELVGLTGDMASFYNLDHETAFEKIKSGISGEAEPLKALGINLSVANLEAYALSKGIKTAYDKMSEAEKVQIRYGYIMQQTADAQGDFVRTQDGYANQVRVLQNNLDTLAASVGEMFIPMLTSAVSWVNSLFAGAETNALQADINNAIDGLSTVEQDVQNIKNNYAKEAIQIKVEFEEANNLIAQLDELKQGRGFGTRTLRQGMKGNDVTALQVRLEALGYTIANLNEEEGVFGKSTEAALKQYQTDMGLVVDGIAGVKTYGALLKDDTEKLVEATKQLVGIYPELEKYVGKDGVLMLEKGQVEALCASYRELQVEKLAAARVEELGGVYADALLHMAMLEQKKFEAETELTKLEAQAAELSRAHGQMSYDYGQGNVSSERFMAAMQNYLNASDLKDIQALIDLTNTGALFDENGLLKSTDNILKMADGLKLLETLYFVIDARHKNGGNPMNDEISEIKTAIDTASEAIEEFKPTLDAAYEEYQLSQRALENMALAGSQAGVTAGQAAREALQSELNNGVRVKVIPEYGTSTTGKPHATGLYRVPYDDYLARLHVGERVLTAAEAREYSASRQEVDYGAFASMMQNTSAEANPRPIQLVLDGRVVAEVLSDHNRTAISGRTRRIDMGYGK